MTTVTKEFVPVKIHLRLAVTKNLVKPHLIRGTHPGTSKPAIRAPCTGSGQPEIYLNFCCQNLIYSSGTASHYLAPTPITTFNAQDEEKVLAPHDVPYFRISHICLSCRSCYLQLHCGFDKEVKLRLTHS